MTIYLQVKKRPNNLTNNIISTGTQSGFNNTNGKDNIFLGFKSGYNNTIGNSYLLVVNLVEVLQQIM